MRTMCEAEWNDPHPRVPGIRLARSVRTVTPMIPYGHPRRPLTIPALAVAFGHGGRTAGLTGRDNPQEHRLP